MPDNSNPLFADLARMVENAGFAQGYSVILCNSDDTLAKESAHVDVLLSKQVDGVIYIPSGQTTEPLERMARANVPVVVCVREVVGMLADQVLVDNEQGGYLAARHLLRLGHREIGYIAGPMPSGQMPNARRLVGFQRACREAGADLPDDCIAQGNLRFDGGAAAARQLFARRTGITAIFAANDAMAFGAWSVLQRAGLRVPEDVSLVGFDNSALSAAMVPALTTVEQPIAQMGQRAVALLLERIKQRDKPVERVLLPPTLVQRESCLPR